MIVKIYSMKKLKIYLSVLGIASLGVVSCSDFDEINENPKAASQDQTQPYYALNKAIIDAQQSPHEAERVFVYQWKSAARYHQMSFFATGSYMDDFNDDYHNSRVSNWIKSATLAISLSDAQIASGKLIGHNAEFIANVKQVSRIWRVYLMTEYVDNFGVMPIEAFQGVTPNFNSAKDVYYFLLDELKDAVAKINVSVEPTDFEKKFDAAYKFDFSKWVKYANSMRLRLSMRLSEIDTNKAQAEFELAAKEALITTVDDVFKVSEKDGWDALTGVMSRSWNQQALSKTMFNILTNLGGINSNLILPEARYQAYIKPENYLGLFLPNHYSENTDDPTKQYFLDGIPAKIDPRAFEMFFLPFDSDADNYTNWFAMSSSEFNLEGDGGAVVSTIDAKFCWNGYPNGFNGQKAARNKLISNYRASYPLMGKQYRTSTNSRVFFGDWETYFLLAEAAVRGWNTNGVSAKDAYEKGIQLSFVYHNAQTSFLPTYLASTDYNMVGTSVAFDHTDEPVDVEMDYVDGYTKAPGKVIYKYPTAAKTLYGKALNDKLTKIITQKYIAQMPYLPLEAWSDFRRLGLPFFEIISAEDPIATMPDWNKDVYKTGQKISLYPQRMKFPASLRNADAKGYNEAISLLGGADETLTPIWWAKKN